MHFELTEKLSAAALDSLADRVRAALSDVQAAVRDYEPMKAYGQSKLANGLFAFELARRLEGTNATANAVHPGIINTNLGRHFPFWQRIAANLFGWLFMKSTEAGAATLACYQAAVGIAAGLAADAANEPTGDNPFIAKYRLFEAGHWPLCVRGAAFYIF